jgi:tRNA 5-methylaminomethyl-2-thiouridine biosynthesis bifunctional protein
MWRPEIYPELRRLSVPGAHIVTYTAAHRVTRGLEANGFTVTKTKGFGHKRERITARHAS